ncbi:dentin sialophosphoprotein-like protein [Perilla frutescens var. hirtella]|nr:dentin sialophosphoprotein-like protein [Perilla frutescens var. hirtella]
MTDLCMYEFEDIIWDDLCQSDDHIVPRPHSLLGDSHKKPHCEVTNISNSTEDSSSAGYVGQGSGVFSSLSKRKNRMLESDSRSHGPSGVFSSSSDGDSTKEASSLAKKTSSSNHVSKNSNADSNGHEFCVEDAVIGDRTTGFGNNSSTDPLGDITQTGNNLNFFENTEVKDSSDFLYYGWPEIENFEDVDRMFRSCDSTFGLGASRDDELGWFSSSDNIGDTGELLNSDFKFSCPESNSVDNLSTNHDSIKSHSSNDAAMMSAPIRLRDSPWISEKPDSYVSFENGPAIVNGEEGFIPKEQMNEHQKQVKLQNQSVGKRKEHNVGNGNLDYTSKLPNEVVQLPSRAKSHQAFSSSCKQRPQHVLGPESCNHLQNHLSYVHPDTSPISDLTSVNPTPSSAVKSETNEFTSPSTRDSSHASILLPHDPLIPVTAPTGVGKIEKLHNCHGSRSLVESNVKPENIVVQPPSKDPGSMAKEAHYTGDKSENHTDIEEVLHFIPAELGSSNIQESSTSSGVNDISLEAASFRQLQLVMEQLDLRTKICIRDSLYRLARSAEQRHNHPNLNSSCGDVRDANGAFITEGEKNFMDIETDTNPIDRSVAHLLFHRPSESSPASTHDSLPFKSPNTVHGSVKSIPVMENMIGSEETVSDTKVSDR